MEERDKRHALAALIDSDGGKVLLSTFKEQINQIVWRFATSYKEADHIELIRLGAELNVALNTYAALKNAKTDVEELDKLIDEALDD